MKKSLHDVLQTLTSEELFYLKQLRSRIEALVKTYGDLSKAGRPPFEAVEEVAIIYKLLKHKVSYGELGRYLGVSKVSVYRWSKAIEKGVVPIYDPSKGVVVKRSVGVEELERIIKELSKARAKHHLRVVTDSKVLQEFVKRPIAIQRSKKRFYTRKEVEETIKVFQLVADYIQKHQDELKVKYDREIPSNPDYWANNPSVFEDIVADIVMTICLEKDPSQGVKYNRCKARVFGGIKRVKAFRTWFQGLIGRVTNRIQPKEATLYLKDVYRLRENVENSGDVELEAFYWIAILHVTIGSREGWGSLKNKVEELRSQGVKLPKRYEKPYSLDLDDEFVDSSLIGLKWKNTLVDPRSRRIIQVKIYERKTKKWAVAKYLDIIDERLPQKLYEFYEYARNNNIHSIVKSIIKYYGVVREKEVTVNWFKNWYSKWCHRLKEMLQLPYTITPHRLRSAHVSILAELRIPLELVLDHNVGFGVGWEDLTTAKIFYLRFSASLVEDYLRNALQIKKKLLG